MSEYNLLKKNELKFSPIRLHNTDLNRVAATVAHIMELDPAEVLVTDVLSDAMTLDILRDTIYPHQILAKKDILLTELGKLPGTHRRFATQPPE